MDAKNAKPLYPGVEIENDLGIKITVYPLGIRHIKKFTDDVSRLVNAMSSIRVPKDADKEVMVHTFIVGLLPIVLTDALDLVKACTVIDPDETIPFDDLPHWLLPQICEVWIEESFGEEKKWKPWVSLIEKTITKVTGKQFSISEIWSNSSSLVGTHSNPSSRSDS